MEEVLKTVTELLEQWGQLTITSLELVPLLHKLIEVVEKEVEAFYKMNPDPFDDRHPSLSFPDCNLGHVLKAIFKNDFFMDRLVSYVMQHENNELTVVACRLLLDVLPGLEISVVFQDTDGLVDRLFQWAESAPDPLQSYATALLAAAMEIQDITLNYRDHNSRLVPIMMRRLQELCATKAAEEQQATITTTITKGPEAAAPVIADRPFAHLNKESLEGVINGGTDDCFKTPVKRRKRSCSMSPGHTTPPHNISGGGGSHTNDCSNSSWAEIEPLMIGSYQIYPVTPSVRMRFILRYLVPMGEYQELLTHVIEYNALPMILGLINLKENPDVWMAFEALKYLAALLCHKKIAMEFINMGGLQALLQVYRPSVAATGVSICLYYLSYCEDAMERVCQLPTGTLIELVKYALWLMECSHDSSRCHAIMFFTLTYMFRPILELFDKYDGLRKLYNVIGTLNIYDEEQTKDLTDDQILSMRHTARNVCNSLRRYYEVHLVIKAQQLRRCRNPAQDSFSATSSYKGMRIQLDNLQEHRETLLELMPLVQTWKPVEELQKLGGIHLLVHLLVCTFEWNYSGSTDLAHAVLEVLAVCSLLPKIQLALCEVVNISESYKPVCMKVVLMAAEGDKQQQQTEMEVTKSSLQVIINCVCGPMGRSRGAPTTPLSSSGGRKRGSGGGGTVRSAEELLARMWTCVRTNNGIMILLKLLSVEAPITDADQIRCLACKALCGLSRCETVRQIMSKLPLFTSGQLQVLMKEPVLQDKRQEYVEFCKHCMTLIERISGAPVTTAIESSVSKINRAEVVAQTKINFNDTQLLQLIHQHLERKGLLETADVLLREANIAAPPRLPSNNPPHFTPSNITPKISRTLNSPKITPFSSHHNTPSKLPELPSSLKPPPTSTPLGREPLRLSLHKLTPGGSPALPGPATSSGNNNNGIGSRFSKAVDKRPAPLQPPFCPLRRQAVPTTSLDSIVTEYLRTQHSLCKNPVVTCPAFDLFVPHQCPEPQFKNTAPANMATRMLSREIFPKHGGLDGARLNRKFIYSRFRPIRTYRYQDTSSYSCCTFAANDQYLLLGTYHGEVTLYNMYTGSLTEESTFNCHDTEISHIEATRDGSLVITCSPWQPMAHLWSFPDFTQKLVFENDSYMEFSKQTQDRLIGTNVEKAHIYDIATGHLIVTLQHPESSNQYKNNRATFDPTDELVLSDGVLWDVRAAPRPIHKFDKFNTNINGVFHPNGLEVVSNSEVWDLRTFHLLHTVPALNQCQVIFNKRGDVMYGAMLQEEEERPYFSDEKNTFSSSFRTFDATNYASIATIDVKKPIYGLATDTLDSYLAIIENLANMSPPSENTCKLYEIGRRKLVDEDMDEEEEEETDDLEESDDEDDDNSEDDDDDDNESEEELIYVAAGGGGGDQEPMETSSEDNSSTDGNNEDDNVLFSINN